MEMYGKHLSPETRAKMSLAHIGKKHSDETRQKLSISHMGKKFSNETKRKMGLAHQGETHIVSDEAKSRMSLVQKGKTLSSEHKAKISLSLIGNTRSIGNTNHLGKRHSEQAKQRTGLANKVLMTTFWQDAERKNRRVRAIMKGCQIKPNNQELQLQMLLDKLYPDEWKYTGDGDVIIGGKNPDFTNINGKKEVIELFGDYWHRGENPQDRISHYKDYGFQCLVIWENELGNTEVLSKKINNFEGVGNQSLIPLVVNRR